MRSRSPGRGPNPRRLSACRITSSSVSSLTGNPFSTFEVSEDFTRLSFRSESPGAAKRIGLANVAASNRKIAIIPASGKGRAIHNLALQEETLVIFQSPEGGSERLSRGKVTISSHMQSV